MARHIDFYSNIIFTFWFKERKKESSSKIDEISWSRKAETTDHSELLERALFKNRYNWLELYTRHTIIRLQSFARKIVKRRIFIYMINQRKFYKKLSLMRFYRALPAENTYIILNANYYCREFEFKFYIKAETEVKSDPTKEIKPNLTLKVSEINYIRTLNPQVLRNKSSNLLKQYMPTLLDILTDGKKPDHWQKFVEQNSKSIVKLTMDRLKSLTSDLQEEETNNLIAQNKPELMRIFSFGKKVKNWKKKSAPKSTKSINRIKQQEQYAIDPIERVDIEVNRKVIIVQSLVRRWSSKRRLMQLKKIKSVPMHHDLQTHEGEVALNHHQSLIIVLMKKADTKQLTLYCWNLSKDFQDLRPIPVDPMSIDLKKVQVWDELFVDLDNRRLYLEDFWDQSNQESQERFYINQMEYKDALEFVQRKIPGKAKFRQRYHRSDPKHVLVGKRTYTFNGMNYILLAFENNEEKFTKISVFSKRTNEFVLHRSVYYQSKPGDLHPKKLDLEQFENIELEAHQINGSSFGLTQSRESA